MNTHNTPSTHRPSLSVKSEPGSHLQQRIGHGESLRWRLEQNAAQILCGLLGSKDSREEIRDPYLAARIAVSYAVELMDAVQEVEVTL
ncbi:MAG: hypothetical protein RLZZ142_2046 [Verrucomicrobiota bacterium]